MVDPSAILEHLKTNFLTPTLHCYNEVGSTNKVAKDLVKHGAGNGTIVIADEQYIGKGRHDRVWWSPYGGLYISLIIDVSTNPEELPLIGLMAGCAVVESIHQLTGLKSQLKWPNDVILNGKKLGGILCELIGNEPSYCVIIGIGINQNITLENIPSDLSGRITTIRSELGKDTSREQLIALIINGIDSRLCLFESQASLHFIVQEWLKVTSTIGRHIEVVTENGKITGKAIGIRYDGSLQVSTADGIIELDAGDVIHLENEKTNKE